MALPQVAVIVTDRQIMPPTRGNRVRILALVRALRALHWKIVAITCHQQGAGELEREVDHLSVIRARAFPGGPITDFDVGPFRQAVDGVTAAFNPRLLVAAYAWLVPAIRRLRPEPPGRLRLVDCHDVLHERTLRFSAAGLDPWIRCTQAEESALLEGADIVLAIQQREAEVLQRMLPHKRVWALLPGCDLPPGPAGSGPQSDVVLTVGSLHAGNDGIRRFASEGWPLVRKARPAARLRIVGSVSHDLPPLPGVECLGELRRVEDLHDQYRSSAVVVCPIQVGTGVKIKMLEALRLGKAVVATPAAAEGMPVPAQAAWRTAGSVEACAQAVTSLLDDPEARRGLEELARSYGEEHLTPARFVADLRGIIAAALPGRSWSAAALRNLIS